MPGQAGWWNQKYDELKQFATAMKLQQLEAQTEDLRRDLRVEIAN